MNEHDLGKECILLATGVSSSNGKRAYLDSRENDAPVRMLELGRDAFADTLSLFLVARPIPRYSCKDSYPSPLCTFSYRYE